MRDIPVPARRAGQLGGAGAEGGFWPFPPRAALLPASRSPGAPAAVPRTATLHRTGTSKGGGRGGEEGLHGTGVAPAPQLCTDPEH